MEESFLPREGCAFEGVEGAAVEGEEADKELTLDLEMARAD